MGKLGSIFSIVLCLLCLVPSAISAEPFLVKSEVYSVKEEDSMYLISLQVYSDAERLRGASWYAIYSYNVELGTIDNKKTPILLGPSGLSVHIVVNQKLHIPHYSGDFPTAKSVISRFGVFSSDGSKVEGFVADPKLDPATILPVAAEIGTKTETAVSVPESEPLAAPVLESVPGSVVEPPPLPFVEPMAEPILDPLIERVAAQVAERTAERVSAQVAERVAERVAEGIAGQNSERIAAQVAEQVATQVAERVAGQVAERIAELIAGQVAERIAAQVAERVAAQIAERVAAEIAERVAGQVAELIAVQVAERVAEQTALLVAAQAAEQVAALAAARAAEEVAAQAEIQAAEEAAAQAAGQLAAQAAEQVAAQAAEEAAAQAAAQAAELAAARAAEEADARAAEEVAAQVAEEAAAQAAAQAAEQAAAQAAEDAAEQVAAQAAEEAAAQAAEQVTAQAVKPAVEPFGQAFFNATEAITSIGMGLYGDSIGFNTELGMQFALGEKFDIDSWLGNGMVGAVFVYDVVFRNEISVAIIGLDLRFGYRFFLADFFPDFVSTLPPVLNIRIIPSMFAGSVFEAIEREGRSVYEGLAWHVAPSLTVDVAPFKDGAFESIRTGLSFGYHYYLSGLVIQKLNAGLFASWAF